MDYQIANQQFLNSVDKIHVQAIKAHLEALKENRPLSLLK